MHSSQRSGANHFTLTLKQILTDAITAVIHVVIGDTHTRCGVAKNSDIIKDFTLLAMHLRLRVMFHNVYREILFISFLATNLHLKVMFDNVYREIAFACI